MSHRPRGQSTSVMEASCYYCQSVYCVTEFEFLLLGKQQRHFISYLTGLTSSMRLPLTQSTPQQTCILSKLWQL
ncbi:hypothetical protein JMJ77_0014513 [Colletotrichum scovillei]|uniref:Uncharacterized protein n=1 Tax=Colletotrichum scovillei TaxID=1209932 RepID=A0A9P7R3P1_9PEZI|nr:hypothetical protein JMJ77_0014513 [Colletotrichum scovillei]KAG7066047.1 hypothetical protein JMJ78_0012785 [Colletotrichum scovillei]KAG7068649.1 hypothetical protein JMJ76_0008330 [Colletotrichum scovillei]